MAETRTAATLIDADADLAALRATAEGCTACDLHRDATQTVFGEGPAAARLVIVGEQPGDQEDRQGHPFVGPAGGELDRGLDAVGIDPDTVYVTNVVKHFKFERRGKRRIHEKPNTIEIRACLPWLRAEMRRLRPRAVLPLGSTAAQALLGRDTRVTRVRGRLHAGPDGAVIVPTVHPSSILRAPSDADRHAARAAFQADLEVVATLLRDGVAAALATRPRDELYQQAQAFELSGRSAMRKAELATALADTLDHLDRDVDPGRRSA